MKTRLITATVLAGALAASVSGAQAASPVLDGKKTKVITLKAVGAAQDHDPDFVTGSLGGPERVECTMPRCARLDFTYKPAKGVTGDVMFEAKWTSPSSDIDLYVAALDKKGNPTQLATCGTFGGTSEKVFLDASNFKAGNKYAVIVDFYRTANENVTATATMPSSTSIPKTVPAPVDDTQAVNCGL